jgi:hypothetical protein
VPTARRGDFGAPFAAPLPVPSTAIYSRTDGIVAWQSCREVLFTALAPPALAQRCRRLVAPASARRSLGEGEEM